MVALQSEPRSTLVLNETMRAGQAHIAGVGTSSATNNSSFDELAISAGTKALLDAGITYNVVDHSVACFLDDQLRIPRSCFDAFGLERAPVSEVDAHSGLFTAVQCVRSGQANCVLLLGLDRVRSKENPLH